MSKTGALYIRVSTDKQEELSPDAQIRVIKEYAIKNDIIILDKYIYKDLGISGRIADKRPAFQEMIATAKSKDCPFDCILLWKFSRFARSQDESAYYKSLLRKKCNIEVISITEPIIDGMYGRLMEMIIEWNDEFYSINLAQEVKRGMTEKAMRGGYQSIPPFGYDHVGHNEPPVVNDVNSKIVQAVFQKYLFGETMTQIARWMNESQIKTRRGSLWETRNITYMLQNPFYIGKLRWNYSNRKRVIKDSSEWIVVDGSHEPIISTEMFNSVQEKIKLTAISLPKRDVCTNKHWLSGLLVCSSCGASLAYQNGKWGRFSCWKYPKALCNVSNSLQQHKAEDDILYILNQMVNYNGLSYALQTVNDTSPEIPYILGELKKLSLKESRIKEAYRNGIDTLEEYAANKKILENEKTVLERKLAEAKPVVPKKSKKTDMLMVSKLQDVINILTSDADYVVKGNALRSICSKIIYDKSANTYDIHCFLSVN